ncbi:MAG: hypothetical protein ACO1TE_17495 [Prosthecobacter sp.]
MTAEDVSRIIRRDFDAARESEVTAVLSEYGQERWQQEAPRVHMAILKLANGDLLQLRHMTNIACGDFRDVLAWAEYQRYSEVTRSDKATREVKEKAMQEDWHEYEAWLHRP